MKIKGMVMSIKKFLATVIALALVLGIVMPMTVSATALPGGPSFSVDLNVDGRRGGTADVPLRVNTGDYAFAAVGFRIEYPATQLQLINVSQPAGAPIPLNNYTPSDRAGEQWISLVHPTNPTDWTGNAVLVNLTFHILPATPVGSTPTISIFYTDDQVSGVPATASGNGIYPGAPRTPGSILVNSQPPLGPGDPGWGGNGGGGGNGNGGGGGNGNGGGNIPPPAANERRLTVNSQGGTGGLTSRNIPRTAWQIPTGLANSPERAGFDFVGWSLTVGGAPITTVPAGDVEITIHALWASQTDQPPPVLTGHRRIVLNAGGGNWGRSPPLDWRRHAPLEAGSNITAIWHDVRVNEAMPTFHTPWVPPASNMEFEQWSRPRTELMSDYDSNSDPGDWASTAQWVESENSNSGGNTPGTVPPPDGVTRPTGAGNLTVIEHFGTWTGSGTRTARVDADHTTFQRLWFGDNLVSTAHLTIASGSTAITLSEAFISGLSDGTYSFISEFTGGHATLNLIVSTGFGDVPQTGVPDITPTLIAMGIALYLTLVTGTMLFFHLRSKRKMKKIFNIPCRSIFGKGKSGL